MQPAKTASARDPRIDLLRGIALLSIFVDHIPDNRLANFTLHNFGFSDAAELFVFLAGYSAAVAYGRVFERDGIRVGLAKVFARCAKIYGVQVLLLLVTLVTVAGWSRWFGMDATIVGPLLRDGFKGAMRGVTLEALPTYLDILPLYIVLLACFPAVRFALARSVSGTLAGAAVLWGIANLLHWDLPSFVDPVEATAWYFNPFTWQFVFVCGAAFAVWVRQRASVLVAPPRLLVAACWAYLLVALLCVDAWKLWPAPFGTDFPGTSAPFALFGNEPKSFVTPWRLAHVLAIAVLALTSPGLMRVARSRFAAPILACGRQSLNVFAVGCVLSLFGRLIFKTAGVTPASEVAVNVVGLATMVLCGLALEWDKARPSTRPARQTDHAPVPGDLQPGARPS